MDQQYKKITRRHLTLIIGGGEGDGIPRGNLVLCHSENTEDKCTDVNEELFREMRRTWRMIADLLSLRQYGKCLGISNYGDLALMAKKVSTSKRIHRLSNEILSLHSRLINAS